MFFFTSIFAFTVFGTLTVSSVLEPEWKGKVFPDPNPIEGNSIDGKYEKDHHGRIPMGVKNAKCDWGQDPEGFDGDLGPQSYTCLNDRSLYLPNPKMFPILKKDHIPKAFVPWHRCMNESIIYNQIIPTFGDHRPLWPKYGEYSFLPKQRWVHSLEHGSIVMLYHPCADHNEVNVLKTILKRCLYQYVITALNELEPDHPLVLVAWGVSLEISKVEPDIVLDFIRRHAFKAPEKVNRDGQYEENLIEAASTDLQGKEDNICPGY